MKRQLLATLLVSSIVSSGIGFMLGQSNQPASASTDPVSKLRKQVHVLIYNQKLDEKQLDLNSTAVSAHTAEVSAHTAEIAAIKRYLGPWGSLDRWASYIAGCQTYVCSGTSYLSSLR